MNSKGEQEKKLLVALICGLLVLLSCSHALAAGKVGLYAHRLSPNNDDAKETAKASWGGGLRVVVPVPQVSNIFAGTFGLEYTDMGRTTNVRYDPDTLLRTEEQSNQSIFRICLGGEVGPHGRGFLRPHAGIGMFVSFFRVDTDIVIPNDSDPENEVRQNFDGDTESVFGYESTLGLDLNFSNAVSVDGGVRYIKAFDAPRQLENRLVEIQPDYFQVYLGVGVSFGLIGKSAAD